MKIAPVSKHLGAAGGGKAAGLRWLARHGYRVPDAWVIIPGANRVDDRELRRRLATFVKPDVRYAVRSSAAVEDGADRSFAGQFESVLDVCGVDAVATAVRVVLASASAESVRAYAAHGAGTDGLLAMSVVIQEMVPAALAGVAFSANPVTGLAETMIEAVEGAGEALVQRGETPERWVRKYGEWIETPPDPRLSRPHADGIADDVATMAAAYGRPVDVEWVIDPEGTTHYVQLRPITGIGDVSYYSNRFSREVLPGIITPLVWSVNIPIVNGAWITLLEKLVGDNGLEPNDLAERIYCRAYFNMGALGTVFDMLGLPREFLEQLSGTDRPAGGLTRPRLSFQVLSKSPRVAVFAAGLVGYTRRADRELRGLQDRLGALREVDPDSMADVTEVFSALDELGSIVERAAEMNVLTPLLSGFYNHRLAATLRRHGLDYLAVDFGNRDDGSQGRDPSTIITRLAEECRSLGPQATKALEAADLDELRRIPEAGTFMRLLDTALEDYGHFSDSGNDFSHVPWREDPSVVIGLVLAQAGATGSRAGERATRADVRRKAGRGAAARFDRASRYQVLRERVSSFYTLAYGYHRPLYLRLAGLLSIDDREPSRRAVFYLTDPELRELSNGSLDRDDARRLVEERLAEELASADIVPPELIIGAVPAPVRAVPGGTLSGAATSPGLHEGRAVKITSASGAPRISEGDVLVVPYSDVSWTPLFSRAGAIVAESGGFLSHTSIVAREYGIPAVVSVEGALRRIPEGARVVVDGFTGTVTIVQQAADSLNSDEVSAVG